MVEFFLENILNIFSMLSFSIGSDCAANVIGIYVQNYSEQADEYLLILSVLMAQKAID